MILRKAFCHLFRFLMSQPDDKDWFEQGNFCKKKVIISAEKSMELNVVQKLIHNDEPEVIINASNK